MNRMCFWGTSTRASARRRSTKGLVDGTGDAMTFRATSPQAAIVVTSVAFNWLIVWRKFAFRMP